MIIYYSYTKNTEKYAKELSAALNDTVFELKEKNPRKGFFGFISGCYQAIAKKEVETESLPDISGDERIYVCTPIWAGGMAPAVRTFLNRTDLKDKETNVLITCRSAADMDNYKTAVLSEFEKSGAKPGRALGFVSSSKQPADAETIRELLSAMLEK